MTKKSDDKLNRQNYAYMNTIHW